MTVEQAITTRLEADAILAAIVGTRIYADYDKSPEDPNAAFQPFIVFGLESEAEETDLYARMWFRSQYAIACVADTADVKVAAANAVKDVLRALPGSYAGLVVKAAILQNTRDEPTDEVMVAGLHSRVVYYEIWHDAD